MQWLPRPWDRMSDWPVVWENQAQDVGEALVETKEVKDLISSHKTLRILMDTQLTIQANTTRYKAIQGNTIQQDKCMVSTNCLSTRINNRLGALVYTVNPTWTSFNISFLISVEFDPYFQSIDPVLDHLRNGSKGRGVCPQLFLWSGWPLLRRLRFGTPATLSPFCVWTGPADYKYEWDQLGVPWRRHGIKGVPPQHWASVTLATAAGPDF